MRTAETKKAGFIVLIDPDKVSLKEGVQLAVRSEQAGADILFVGGSLLFTNELDALLTAIKKEVTLPVVLFPGGVNQISKKADAILFMSLISGRSAEYLIGEQVKGAPLIKRAGLEPISVGYMLIESGRPTTAQFMSGTFPIPRHKPEIAAAHALAGEFLGMKLIYMDGGSGAEQSVPERMIGAVRKYVSIPLIVGGGIRTPESAEKKVKAGANFIVTGTIFEQKKDPNLMVEMADAIHGVLTV